MEKITFEIPKNDFEYSELSEDKKDEIIDKYQELKNKMDKFIESYIEESLAELLIKHPSIEQLTLDPKYEYNDEGYAPHYIMPFINGEYWGDGESIDDDLFEKIDYACAKVAHLITEDVSLDVDLIRKKYSAKKLDSELPSNNNKTSKKFKA